MRRACSERELHGANSARTLKRVSSFAFLFSIFVRSEPAAAEQESRTERGKKNRTTISARQLCSILQGRMQSRAARGRAEVAGVSGNRRKSVRGNSALLREQSHKARIRLVRRKTADGTSREPAAEFNSSNHFVHARGPGAGKGFT